MKTTIGAAGVLAAAWLLGASSANAQGACDRTCLEGFIDRYLDAVIANDPARVPLAGNVRYTENGQRLVVGDGLWRSMKAKGTYRLLVSDVEAGQAAYLGTIQEDGRTASEAVPALIALRLKVARGQITEVELQIARSVDAAQRVEALGKPHALFTATIPSGERMSRADLIATADKYFTGMQQNDGKGDYPFAPDCSRIENGAQTTNQPTRTGEVRPDPATSSNYSAQWSCLEQFESGLLHFVSRIRDRRYVAVDPERGLVLAYAFFDHFAGETRNFSTPTGRAVTAGPAQPWTWYIAELFRIENGKLRQIEAVLERVPYGMLSGWSTWEEGMSDRARDVTR
jgi:hypothetical protein